MRKNLVCLFLLGVSAAFGAKQLFTTSDLFNFRTVGDPQISRDGKSVLYVLGWSDKMNDAFYSNIWVADADGKGQRPLTQGSFKDSSPRWSPDGTRIAYLSNRSGKVADPRDGGPIPERRRRSRTWRSRPQASRGRRTASGSPT